MKRLLLLAASLTSLLALAPAAVRTHSRATPCVTVMRW